MTNAVKTKSGIYFFFARIEKKPESANHASPRGPDGLLIGLNRGLERDVVTCHADTGLKDHSMPRYVNTILVMPPLLE